MSAPTNTILVGDATDQLRALPPDSVDCVITSPPFYMLRNYGAVGQIGLEETVHEWVERLRAVMVEVARVLVPTGSAWIDLGDSYSRHPRYGAAAKGLLLAPERLLLALSDDGWIVRNKVIWAKANPMPASVGDRLTCSYDSVYFLTRQPKYLFDLDAIRVPHTSAHGHPGREVPNRRPDWAGPLAGSNSGLHRARPEGTPGHLLGKNPSDVWRLPTASYRGAHFATFPEVLVERPLLATCPLKVCTACRSPWKRSPGLAVVQGHRRPAGRDRHVRRYPGNWRTLHRPGPIRSGCDCGAPTRPGLVLDPFFGTGTVGVVAERHNRDWLGIELNPEYVQLAQQRLRGRSPSEKRAA
jgi:site-specific DNA-methyltransferase (adenine-specific)